MLNRIKNKLRRKNLAIDDNELTRRALDYAQNDILVVVPDLCSNEYPNVNVEIFEKLLGYKKGGMSFDTLVVNDNFIYDTYVYEYKNIKILRTGYNQLRNLLLNKNYKKILIHKPVLTYYKILNAVNLINTQVILYSYGNDLFQDIRGLTDKYAVSEYKDIYNYNMRDNFEFVFQNDKHKDLVENEYSIKFNNTRIYSNVEEDIKDIKKFKGMEKFDIPSLKKNPLLSISIASYNVEKFIVQILCNLLRTNNASELEILVVNDGSKDGTVKVVKEFLKKYYKGSGEPIIRLIDKENGGHGSTINKGLELATGKYFRLLDGDDYYVIDQFDKFINILKNEDSDMIFTEYYEDFSVTGEYKKNDFYKQLIPGYQYKFDDLCKSGKEKIDWGPLLHTTVYKTKLLKDLNFKIDEHCFYVDNEFNLMGVFAAESVTFYPLYIYSYYLGRTGQSVSPESYKKNVKQLEKVCLRIIEETENQKKLSKEKKNYIEKHMVVGLAHTMYWIVTSLCDNGKNFIEFDDQLKKYPMYYQNQSYINRRIKLLRKTRGHFFKLIVKK